MKNPSEDWDKRRDEVLGLGRSSHRKTHYPSLRRQMAELQRTQEALRASEAKYRDLVESANSIIVQIDTEGRFTFVNKFAQRFFGFEESELIGHHIVGTIVDAQESTGRDLRAFIDDLTRNPDRYVTHENENVRKNGDRVWVAWTNKARVNEDGKITSILAIGNDVTEHRMLEAQLRQARKMEAVGQLAGGIAHDFNNVLVGIMGYADQLARDAQNDEDRNRAETIVRSARRAADLTSQLLAFARKSEHTAVRVDLHAIIEETIGLLKHSIDPRIVIRCALDARPPSTKGDPTQLQTVFLNLAINARDAMPNGGTLTFKTDNRTVENPTASDPPRELSPGEYVCVSVCDTGTGMDRRTQERIFDPFFTTKEKGHGTGLGLAAVFGIVKSHHGIIQVLSAPGEGSTFEVLLPLSTTASRTEHVEKPSLARGHGKILLADDEHVVREVARTMLATLGYDVLVCPDGLAAVEQYGKNWQSIDLVILDMSMPKLGGRETFLKLKEINPSVRVIFSTGYTTDLATLASLGEGVTGLLPKPYVMATLAEKVAESMGKRVRRREAT